MFFLMKIWEDFVYSLLDEILIESIGMIVSGL